MFKFTVGQKVPMIRLKKEIKETKYLWGNKSEIEGQNLALLEENKNGDCLCVFKDKGIVDVKKIDIDR